MPRYCFDTSGLSHPHETMPEDIHDSMWNSIKRFIADGNIAVNTEIFDEMVHIDGGLGDFIASTKATIVLEVGGQWDWNSYLGHTTRMQNDYRRYISEFNGGSKRTVGLNDISIIALAKTLNLPLVSMESRVRDPNSNKRRIPDICDMERVSHLTFIEFLRTEGQRF